MARDSGLKDNKFKSSTLNVNTSGEADDNDRVNRNRSEGAQR